MTLLYILLCLGALTWAACGVQHLIDRNVRRHVDRALPSQQSSNVTRIDKVKQVRP